MYRLTDPELFSRTLRRLVFRIIVDFITLLNILSSEPIISPFVVYIYICKYTVAAELENELEIIQMYGADSGKLNPPTVVLLLRNIGRKFLLYPEMDVRREAA